MKYQWKPEAKPSERTPMQGDIDVAQPEPHQAHPETCLCDECVPVERVRAVTAELRQDAAGKGSCAECGEPRGLHFRGCETGIVAETVARIVARLRDEAMAFDADTAYTVHELASDIEREFGGKT